MALSIRQTEILAMVRSEGRGGVETLASRFDVSVQTIRRDLAELSEAGFLDRVHGGAVARTGVVNIAYEERRRMNEAAKADVARACAAAIPDNASVIMNLGSTTEAVARELLAHRNLTVVTNNINIALILLSNPSCEVLVAGGTLRRTDGGLIGELATEFFEKFKVDFAVVGCSAMDADGDLLDFDLSEVRVSKAILRQARQSFLVTDISKFERSAPVRLCSLSEIDVLFIDQALPGDLMSRCEDWSTKVLVAQPKL